MSKAKFQEAKDLIQEKRYNEARDILDTIDHPKATDWILKLEKRSTHSANVIVKPAKGNKSRIPLWLKLAIIAALLAGIAFVVISDERRANRNLEAFNTCFDLGHRDSQLDACVQRELGK